MESWQICKRLGEALVSRTLHACDLIDTVKRSDERQRYSIPNELNPRKPTTLQYGKSLTSYGLKEGGTYIAVVGSHYVRHSYLQGSGSADVVASRTKPAYLLSVSCSCIGIHC